MNSVNLIGNLTADIKLETSSNQTHYARFSLAVRRDANHTDFINCVAFGKTAEMLSDQLKGSKIGVSGSWQTGSYQNQQGQKVYTNDCSVYRVYFLSPLNKDADTRNTAPSSATPANNYVDPFVNNGQAIDISDNDLPF